LSQQVQQRISDLIKAIRALQPDLETRAQAFRQDSSTGFGTTFDKWSDLHWCTNTFGNALVRLRILVENNFRFIETLGLLAVTRYVFELSIWLRLLKSDTRFGMVYYRELLETQLRYFKDTAVHYGREIDLLRDFEQKQSTAISRARIGDPRPLGASVGRIMDEIDAAASRQFSVFADEAKTRGYGFQAHLVESKFLPEVQKAITEAEAEIEELRRRTPPEVSQLAKGTWRWRQMAEKAGLANEHDYIYSYASKLLHATPASVTTDNKNLEAAETCLFLRYVYAKLLEIIDLADDAAKGNWGVLTRTDPTKIP
jgi:hypothetical protein